MGTLKYLNDKLAVLAGCSLALIILVTVVDVLSVNVRGRPITGVYDAVETLLAYLVFLGWAETFRSEQNITVDAVDHFVSAKAVIMLRAAAAILSVVFMILLLWSMIRPALDAVRFRDFKGDSGIPFSVIWAGILFGTMISIASAAGLTIHILRRFGKSGVQA